MKKVYIYGAGGGADNYINAQAKYKVVGVVDTDREKHGQILNDFTIEKPEILFAESKVYDCIVVASVYYTEIREYLITNGIAKELIIPAEKRLMAAPTKPLEDKETYDFAVSLMEDITRELHKNKITYQLAFGTLLGIIRDGDLIPWDDDIDIAVNINNICDVKRIVREYIERKSLENLISIREEKYDNESELFSIKVDGGNFKEIKIDIAAMKLENEYLFYNNFILPYNYCNQNDEVLFNKVKYSVPKKYKELLTYIYGNWEIPQKDFTMEGYNNMQIHIK